jgi:hypothetical protein
MVAMVNKLIITHMTDLRIAQRQYAMNLGTCMGIFWALKFTLVPLGLQYGFLLMVYAVLTLAVPFIGYRFVAMFRDKACGGFIGFAQACLFLLSMYLFASLLASVAHYIYFAFIDNGFMAAKMTAIINAAMQVSPVSEEDRATLDEALKEFAALTPADFTLQYLSSDIVFCSLLSVPTALLAVRRRRRSEIEMLKDEETK